MMSLASVLRLTQSQDMSAESSVNVRIIASIALMVCAVYGLSSTFVGEDLHLFLFPWIDHIRTDGPVRAFREPFGNYTPPYLYLLAIGTLLTDRSLVIIKVLGAMSCGFAAAAVWRLVRIERGCILAAVMSLSLPTMIIDGPMLGQCDGIWVALCLLSVAAAIEGRMLATVVWCGMAFAFKAQSAFIAPFVLTVLIQRRASIIHWIVPPAIYCIAMLPAWLAGWPATDLATIYLRQAEYFNTIGSSPGIWAIGVVILPRKPTDLFLIGYAAGIIFFVMYVVLLCRRKLSREQMIEAAILSALALPFLLPKMHERFTLLADLLALSLAFISPKRGNGVVATAVVGASSTGYLSYMLAIDWLPIIGCLVNAWVLFELLKRLFRATAAVSQPVHANQAADRGAIRIST
jgi:Gpi18-like mannosyltransferase